MSLLLASVPTLLAQGKEEEVEIKIVLQDGADLEKPLGELLKKATPEKLAVWFFDTPKLDWFGQSKWQVILRARVGEPPAETDVTVKLRADTDETPAQFEEWRKTAKKAGAKAKVEADLVYSADNSKKAKESLSVTAPPVGNARDKILAAQKAGSAQGIKDLFTPPQWQLLDAAMDKKFDWDGLRAFGLADVTKWDLPAADFPQLAGLPIEEVTVERWIFGGATLTELSIKVPKLPKEAADAARLAFGKAVEAKGLSMAVGDSAEAKTQRFLRYFAKLSAKP